MRLAFSCLLLPLALAADDISLSTPCAAAVFTLLPAYDCPVLLAGIANASWIGDCVAPVGVAALGGCDLPVAQLLVVGSHGTGPCGVCSTLAPCQSALSALLQAASIPSGALSSSCGGPADILTLLLLRDQSAVTCNNQYLATGEIPLRISGNMSLAGLSQCTSCALSTCAPGMYCPGGTALPIMCPPRFYCPPPGLVTLQCPAGYFCPEGSSAPLSCRSIASCPAGAQREVVWVPLFLVLLMLVGVSVWLHEGARAWIPPLPAGLSLQKAAVGGHATKNPASARALEASGCCLPSAAARPAPANPAATRIGIVFRDLSLGKRVSEVTGVVRPSTLTAIMGGSGAGKTSLASLIIGREKPTGGSVGALLLRVQPSPAVGAVGGGSSEKERTASPASAADAAAEPIFLAPVTSIRRGVGAVPQTDVLMRSLTVRQVIAHSAAYRLSCGPAERQAAVNAVIEACNLTHVADSRIGDDEQRGISGGERKRTNVAVELVASPQVIVADEPTSGLDATAAYEVMELLRSAAHERGVTVMAIIHQPRPEIVAAIDDLILLGRGGQLIYCGPMSLVQRYVEELLGFGACAPDTAAMDWVMDCLDAKNGCGSLQLQARIARVIDSVCDASASALAVASTSAAALPSAPLEQCDVGVLAQAAAQAWREEGEEWVVAATAAVPSSDAANLGGLGQFSSARAVRGGAGSSSKLPAVATQQQLQLQLGKSQLPDVFSLPPPPPAALAEVLPPHPGFLAQLAACTYRGLLQHTAGNGLLFDLCAMLAGGAVIGIVASDNALLIPPVSHNYYFSCPPGAELFCQASLRQKVEPITFYLSIAVGVLSVPPAVRALGAEKPVFWREVGSGLSRLAYFLSRILAEIPKMCLLAFCFVAPMVAIGNFRGPVEQLYFALLINVFFMYAMSFILAAFFLEADAATLVGSIVGVVGNLFSGFVPLLGDGGMWCYSHWVQRAYIAIEIGGYGVSTYVFDHSVASEHTGSDWPHDLAVLFLDALCTFVVAFLVLCLRHRDQQK